MDAGCIAQGIVVVYNHLLLEQLLGYHIVNLGIFQVFQRQAGRIVRFLPGKFVGPVSRYHNFLKLFAVFMQADGEGCHFAGCQVYCLLLFLKSYGAYLQGIATRPQIGYFESPVR